MKRILTPAIALAALGLATANADTTIADWTFESSLPASFGPFNPEVGSGSASFFDAGPTVNTISNPSGNGSSHSFSSNGWDVGDYFQFSVSTLGFDNITVSFDEASSNTGPRDFTFEYSTDGTTFNTISLSGGQNSGNSPYEVFPNAAVDGNVAWNPTTSQGAFNFSVNLSGISAVNNAASVTFRLVDADTTAANSGSPVATSGTDRVDNFTVTSVPEPSTLALGLVAAFAGLAAWRRKA